MQIDMQRWRGLGDDPTQPIYYPTEPLPLIADATPIPNWLLLLAAAFLIGWFVQSPYQGKRK